MRRRPTKARLARILAAAARMVAAAKLTSGEGVGPAEFARTRRPPMRSRPGKVPRDRIQKLRAQAAEIVGAAAWHRANAGHLVALYAACHLEVYGVEAAELLEPQAWGLATVRAARLMNQFFDGQPQGVVEFVRWTWSRERRKGGGPADPDSQRRRIGWQLQFSSTLVTDYRRWELHASKVRT